MRKLGRILRRCLTALSLLLFLAVLAAWVRGYWNSNEAYLAHTAMNSHVCFVRDWAVSCKEGTIRISISRYIMDAAEARDKAWPEASEWFVRRTLSFLTLDDLTAPAVCWNHGGVVLTRYAVWGRLTRFRSVGSFQRGVAYWLPCYMCDRRLTFPCWMAAVVFGALPSWRFIAWWRSRRRRLAAAREGRCPLCGYDLRASPERCPECGLAVEEKREARSEKREDGEHRTLNKRTSNIEVKTKKSHR